MPSSQPSPASSRRGPLAGALAPSASRFDPDAPSVWPWRSAELGRCAAHVAADLRSRLGSARLYLTLLKRRLSDDPGSRDVLEQIESRLSSVADTVHDLLYLAFEPRPQAQRLALRGLVDEVLDSFAPQMQQRGLRPKVDVDGGLWLHTDRVLLRRALVSLVQNAVEANPPGGEVAITAVATESRIELEVADDGPGLSDQVKRQWFVPFLTTKHDSAGLGLTVALHGVRALGGEIVARNCPEGGAAFTLQLPRALPAREAVA